MNFIPTQIFEDELYDFYEEDAKLPSYYEMNHVIINRSEIIYMDELLTKDDIENYKYAEY